MHYFTGMLQSSLPRILINMRQKAKRLTGQKESEYKGLSDNRGHTLNRSLNMTLK